jgi:CheY-like chemotaxis protein
MVRLFIHPPSAPGFTFELGERWITIGRGDANLCQIPETTVSDRHCEVKWTGAELLVRDLCSTNGVLVNGMKITEGVVHPGQVFSLGNAEVRLEQVSPVPKIALLEAAVSENQPANPVFSLRHRPLKPAPAATKSPAFGARKASPAPQPVPLPPGSRRARKGAGEVFSLRQRSALSPTTESTPALPAALPSPPPEAIPPTPPATTGHSTTVFSLRQRPAATSAPASPEAAPPAADAGDTVVFSLRHRPLAHSAPPAQPLPQPTTVSEVPPPADAPRIPDLPPPVASAPAAEKKQILLVDDSLAFLDSFASVCREFSGGQWQMHTVTSAEQALSFLAGTPVDLAVLDIGMPMVDGIQLLGLIRRRYPTLKVAMLTGLYNETNRAACLADGAELFLEKPLSPSDLKRSFDLLQSLVSHNPQKGFTGTLEEVSLPEVIQLKCLAGKSVILEVRNAAVSGRIYIEFGQVIHASAGRMTGEQAFLMTGEQSVALTGEPAFQALLALDGGQFQLLQFTPPPLRTIAGAWEFLLMNAACFEDETRFVGLEPAPQNRVNPMLHINQ